MKIINHYSCILAILLPGIWATMFNICDYTTLGAPRGLGIWLFIFRGLGSTGNCLRDLGSKLIVLGI